MFKRKALSLTLFLFIIFSIISIYICNHIIGKAAEGKLYSSVETIPYNKVGLLLGTSKYIRDSYINPYYSYRINAAVELFKAGKINYIVVSGDNGRKDYNEPELMRADLIAAGIDSNHIFMDYAGFRTFDSIVRVKEVFSQDSVTIISQPFHNERAVYIASKESVYAVGFNAKDVDENAGLRVQAREKLARVKVFFDYLLGIEPRFLGSKVNIP